MQHRQRDQRQKAQEANRHIGNLLADQEFDNTGRRHPEIADRADLAFAHDGQRRQHRRNQGENHHDAAGHNGEDAAEVLIVAIARLDPIRQNLIGAGRSFGCQARHQAEHHVLEIAACGLGLEGFRAVLQEGDLRPVAPRKVAPEARRNIDDKRDPARGQSPLDIGLAGKRRVRLEPGRAAEFLDQLAARGGPVAVKRGEGDAVDVEDDAIAEDEQKQHRACKGEDKPDRIAQQLDRLAPREGRNPDQRRDKAGLRRRAGRREFGGFGRRPGRSFAGLGRGLLQIVREHILERGCAGPFHQFGRRADGDHLAAMHQRNAVTAFGLVHEMRRDKDRHAAVA